MRLELALLIAIGYQVATAPAIIAINYTENRLPNRLVLPGLLFNLVGVVGSMFLGQVVQGAYSLGAGLIVFIALTALNFAGGIGMGDAKLITALTLPLAFVAWWLVPMFLVLIVISSIIQIVALRVRGSLATSLPMGANTYLAFFLCLVVINGMI